MNVKKYLKKQAQQDLKDLETDSDREFLARLKESAAEQPKRNKNWLWAIPSGVAVCAAVLVGTLVPLSHGDDIRYDAANFVCADSDLETFSNATKNLTVHFTEDQGVDVKKTYDSVSGHDLFYTLTIEENTDTALYNLETRIVVNDKYEFEEFNITEAFITQTYSNYSVIYDQKIIVDSDMGLNLVQCKAKIDKLKYAIYVTRYEELSLDNGTFLNVIANLFDFS